MIEFRTLSECYAYFGVLLANPRRVWSAIAPDGRLIVTLWSNRFVAGHYDVFDDVVNQWVNRPENKVRLRQLLEIGLDGRFESIIIVPAVVDVPVRTITRRYVGPSMRLTALSLRGEFRAEPWDGKSICIP